MDWDNVPKLDFDFKEHQFDVSTAFGLAVGQTWKTKEGRTVHVIDVTKNCGFKVQTTDGLTANWTVDGYGRTAMSMRNYDLAERVERVYIAGPMTGMIDLNFPAFHTAAAEYRKRGAFVINPAEINGGDAEIAQTEKMSAEQYHAHWVKCLKKDISALLTCDTIVMLPGWSTSRGATLEHYVADVLGMTITYED
jgi:hypothetical protein